MKAKFTHLYVNVLIEHWCMYLETSVFKQIQANYSLISAQIMKIYFILSIIVHSINVCVPDRHTYGSRLENFCKFYF